MRARSIKNSIFSALHVISYLKKKKRKKNLLVIYCIFCHLLISGLLKGAIPITSLGVRTICSADSVQKKSEVNLDPAEIISFGHNK